MVIFYKKWKKYNEIQLTKNKMELNIRKMTNHPPSPGIHLPNDLNTFTMVLRRRRKLVGANGEGFHINQFFFADDSSLMADSEEKLARLVS